MIKINKNIKKSIKFKINLSQENLQEIKNKKLHKLIKYFYKQKILKIKIYLIQIQKKRAINLIRNKITRIRIK